MTMQKQQAMKKITFTINGVKHQAKAGPDDVLIDILREDLGLTGTKQSCDRKGQLEPAWW